MRGLDVAGAARPTPLTTPPSTERRLIGLTMLPVIPGAAMAATPAATVAIAAQRVVVLLEDARQAVVRPADVQRELAMAATVPPVVVLLETALQEIVESVWWILQNLDKHKSPRHRVMTIHWEETQRPRKIR